MMVDEVEKHPDVEMVIGAHDTIHFDSGETEHIVFKACYVEDNRWIRYMFFRYDNPYRVVVWNKLIKKSFIENNSLYFKEGVIHEDEHWSFYAFRNLKRLSVIEQKTYHHYVRPGSIMTSRNAVTSAVSFRYILDELTKSFDNPFRSLLISKYLSYFLMFVFPFLPRSSVRSLYFRFVNRLLSVGELKIACYLFVNWFHKFRIYRLTYIMVPERYRYHSKRCYIHLKYNKIQENN